MAFAFSDDTTFIIAELSANHGQKLENAIAAVRAAKECGADAIKVQTYTADTITLDCDNEYFKINHGTIWDGTTLHKLYQQAYTPWDWHEPIQKEAERCGLVFFSTPFDPTSVDFLEALGVPLYKIASFEINDIPLIQKVASKGKPVMISTGVATLADIEEALAACRGAGNNQITLLKCTSSYPAPAAEANLRTIPNMAATFGTRVGLSDHTLGDAVAITAVALGARVIEKHFIPDRTIGGPDASFSMEPPEFKRMVENIRVVEQALGRVCYDLSEQSVKSRQFSRSLFVAEDIKQGAIFTEENLRSVRPAHGMHTRYLHQLLGQRARLNIKKGTPMDWKYVANETDPKSGQLS